MIDRPPRPGAVHRPRQGSRAAASRRPTRRRVQDPPARHPQPIPRRQHDIPTQAATPRAQPAGGGGVRHPLRGPGFSAGTPSRPAADLRPYQVACWPTAGHTNPVARRQACAQRGRRTPLDGPAAAPAPPPHPARLRPIGRPSAPSPVRRPGQDHFVRRFRPSPTTPGSNSAHARPCSLARDKATPPRSSARSLTLLGSCN